IGDNAVCKELEGTTKQDLEDDHFLQLKGLGSRSMTTVADNSVVNFMKLAFAEVCQMVVHRSFSGFSLPGWSQNFVLG
ncbi:hypothetical protein KC19_VG127500, partial [Ceratodon purpureus]